MNIFSFIIATLMLLFLLRRVVILVGAVVPRKESLPSEIPPSMLVLISAHDEQTSLPGLFTALESLQYPADRLFFTLISDGSSDATAALMTAWAQQHANAAVRVLGTNVGKSEALAAGLEISPSSEVIVTVDADTLPERDCLLYLAAPFLDPRVGAAGGLCSVRNPRETLISRYSALEHWMHFFVNSAGKDRWDMGPIPSGGLAAYRREALQAADGFLPAMADDVPSAVRLISRGYRTRFVERAVVRTQAVCSLAELIAQRQRWSAGLASAARYARGVETLLVAAGYLDRVVLALVFVLAIAGSVPLALPLSYVIVLIAAAVTAVIRAGHSRRIFSFLAVAAVLMPLELWMSIRALACRATPRWLPASRGRAELNSRQT